MDAPPTMTAATVSRILLLHLVLSLSTISANALISPFAKALIAREGPLPSELPLELLHYSASLADPQLTVASGREVLETAFADLLGSDRGVRVLSASFPKVIAMLMTTCQVTCFSAHRRH